MINFADDGIPFRFFDNTELEETRRFLECHKKLGKTVSTDKPKFSYKQKIEYYSGRIDDMSLRPGQRNHAVKRLQELAKK